MRLLIVTSLFVPLLLVSACNNRPQTVAGNWACTTTHPGGFSSKDNFHFGEKGELSLDSDGVVMHGSYTVDGKALSMKLTDVPVPVADGAALYQLQILNASIQKLTDKEMALDVSSGNNRHLSQCRRL